MLTGFKTVLFNLFMGGILLLAQKFDFGLTSEEAKPIVDSAVTIIWAVGNIVLRTLSNTTIFKKTSPAPMPDGTPCSNQSGKAPIMSMVMISCLSLGLVSCATLGININSPQKKYLVARTSFNDLMDQYIAQADRIPLDKRLEIQVGIKATDKALDTWERSVLDPEYDFSKDMAVWLEFKTMVIGILEEVKK